MPQLILVEGDGRERPLEGAAGRSVMEVIRANGVEALLALCGGCCSCGTCHVLVDPEWLGRLPPMAADEDGLLDFSDYRSANSRLACQLRFGDSLDGLRLQIAPED